MRAVVGFCPSGKAVEIYEGDLDGVIVFPARGESPYGWNRCFRPDGHKTVGGVIDGWCNLHLKVTILIV